jgi:hypothetical protein
MFSIPQTTKKIEVVFLPNPYPPEHGYNSLNFNCSQMPFRAITTVNQLWCIKDPEATKRMFFEEETIIPKFSITNREQAAVIDAFEDYSNMGIEDHSEDHLQTHLITPLVHIFNPHMQPQIYSYAGFPFERNGVDFFVQLNGRIDLVSAKRPRLGVGAEVVHEQVRLDQKVECLVREHIVAFTSYLDEIAYLFPDSPEATKANRDDPTFDEIIVKASSAKAQEQMMFAFTAASMFKENNIYVSLLMEVKKGDLETSGYQAQALGYAASVANYLNCVLEYPPPFLITVMLSNGRDFMMLRVLYNHFNFTGDPAKIPLDGRNYCAKTDVYSLFKKDGSLDLEVASKFKFYCNPLAVLREYIKTIDTEDDD